MQSEAQKKYQSLLKAVDKYNAAVPDSPASAAGVIWRKGAAKLLDYGQDMQGPIRAYSLIIPSLINRHYILDLSERRSFIQHLKQQGIYPIMLDWNEPGEDETAYDMADYVTNILLPAIEFTHRSTGQPVHLMGYCLGGVLTLAAAQLKPEYIASLSMLATPWNFESEDTFSPNLSPEQVDALEKSILATPLLDPMILQWLFMFRQGFSFEQKFLKFNEMTDKNELEDFIHIERWVNDGVPMASHAAVDCLVRWGQKNELCNGKWRVNGTVINPKQVNAPCFVVIPNQDKIVPKHCAQALADALPNAKTCCPDAGHVGMIVGSNAKAQMWEPYVEFIRNLSL